jgi:hypothetical protein
VDGTGIVEDRPFTVLNGAPRATNAAKLVKLATAEATIAKAVVTCRGLTRPVAPRRMLQQPAPRLQARC